MYVVVAQTVAEGLATVELLNPLAGDHEMVFTGHPPVTLLLSGTVVLQQTEVEPPAVTTIGTDVPGVVKVNVADHGELA